MTMLQDAIARVYRQLQYALDRRELNAKERRLFEITRAATERYSREETRK